MILTEKGRQKLATIMVVQDVSQRELATAAGWASHSYLGRLMRGTAHNLEPDPAAAIAAYLGVGMDTFFVPKSSIAGARSVQRGRTRERVAA